MDMSMEQLYKKGSDKMQRNVQGTLQRISISQRNNDKEQGVADLASFSESAQQAVAREEPCV